MKSLLAVHIPMIVVVFWLSSNALDSLFTSLMGENCLFGLPFLSWSAIVMLRSLPSSSVLLSGISSVKCNSQLGGVFFLSFRYNSKKLMTSYTGMEECEDTNKTTKRKM